MCRRGEGGLGKGKYADKLLLTNPVQFDAASKFGWRHFSSLIMSTATDETAEFI